LLETLGRIVQCLLRKKACEGPILRSACGGQNGNPDNRQNEWLSVIKQL